MNIQDVDYEYNRIKNLKSYEHANIPEDTELDDIVKLASILFQTPIVFISLVYETKTIIKSSIGIDIKELDRSNSICNTTILQSEILEIYDLNTDNKYIHNQFYVDKHNIRYYAGIPLKTKEGFKIGTLSILDSIKNKLDDNKKFAFKALNLTILKYFELKRLKNELKMNNKSNCINKTKEDFLNNISHELRTPLNAIFGFSQVLLKTNLLPDQLESVNIIKSSVENLIEIVNDVLDYTRIESGNLKIEYSTFDIRKIIDEIYKLLSVKALMKGININFRIDRKIPEYIIGDKVRINQIITNLLVNALKFTDKGCIEFNIKLKKESSNNIELFFSIKDTGIGIDYSDQEKIFDKFEQIRDFKTRQYSGTGLGLSICKNLVELLGGKLNVTSVLGQGSEFFFSLKFGLTTEFYSSPEKYDTECKNNRRFEKLNILLFEDTLINIKLIERIVCSLNMSLEIAENGKIGIEKLKNKNFDLIFMDLNMPEMNGFEATAYIRNNMKLDIPIIAMTANRNYSEKKRCLEMGMDDYLTKPFKQEELFTSISNVLNKKDLKKSNQILSIRKSKLRFLERPIQRKMSLNANKDVKKSNLLELNIEEIQSEQISSPATNLNKFSILKRTKTFNQGSDIPKDKKTFERINLETLIDFSGGDVEYEKDLIERFLKDFPSYMVNLEDNIHNCNYDEIKKLAHKMKSSVAFFGLNKVQQMFRDLENLGKEQDIIKIRKSFDLLKCNIHENIKELNFLMISKYK